MIDDDAIIKSTTINAFCRSTPQGSTLLGLHFEGHVAMSG
jgi:hypothetical protein